MRLVALLRALLLAMLLTAAYTLLLYVCVRSVGVRLGLLKTFIVFSLGMLTSTVTPTPGGLVGAEAGLYAGFVAYDVGAVSAGAAVLLFRLVSYWLPLLPGAFALLLAKRRKLL
jgi:undecaprenyl-diphosphatase